MENYDKLIPIVESIFNSLDIKYNILTFEDSDLNYSIQITTIGKLKLLNSINCILYFRQSDFTMNLLVANIYLIKNETSLLPIYEAINQVNSNSYNGNYSIFDTNKQIIYKSTVYCGKDFVNLDSELLRFQIVPFASTLDELIDLLTKK